MSNAKNKFSQRQNCATLQMKNQLCLEFVSIKFANNMKDKILICSKIHLNGFNRLLHALQ